MLRISFLLDLKLEKTPNLVTFIVISEQLTQFSTLDVSSVILDSPIVSFSHKMMSLIISEKNQSALDSNGSEIYSSIHPFLRNMKQITEEMMTSPSSKWFIRKQWSSAKLFKAHVHSSHFHLHPSYNLIVILILSYDDSWKCSFFFITIRCKDVMMVEITKDNLLSSLLQKLIMEN